jgi:ArsR family transcriptional regulator, cadmium/lead-responsive transcriptional repressor
MLMIPPAHDLPLKAKLFRGLADPSRLGILETLGGGAKTVGELVLATGLTQPNVSNHLACLHGCGLVVREQRGRHVSYRLSNERVAALLGLADHVLTDVASGLCTCPRCHPSPVFTGVAS